MPPCDATSARTLRLYFLSLLPFKTETIPYALYKAPFLYHAYFTLLPISLYSKLFSTTLYFPYLPHRFPSLSISPSLSKPLRTLLSIRFLSCSPFLVCGISVGSFPVFQSYIVLSSARAVFLSYYCCPGSPPVFLRRPNFPHALHLYCGFRHDSTKGLVIEPCSVTIVLAHDRPTEMLADLRGQSPTTVIGLTSAADSAPNIFCTARTELIILDLRIYNPNKIFVNILIPRKLIQFKSILK